MLLSSVKLSALTLLIAVLPSSLVRAADDGSKEEENREQIGEVLGKPLYRDEIRTDRSEFTLLDLREKVVNPVTNAYRKAHQDALAPTPEEIQAADSYFKAVELKKIEDQIPKLSAELEAIREKLKSTSLNEKEKRRLSAMERQIDRKLNPDVTSVRDFTLSGWKFERHLYENFGGGRVTATPFGGQAPDAKRTFLEAQEKQRRFKLTDSKMRKVFAEGWLNDKDPKSRRTGSSDPEDIRKWLLEPEWAPKETK